MVYPGLAIVIPAHNEAGTIGSVVSRACQYGAVIVVNDRSQDATATIASEAGARVVENTGAGGYDSSLDLGFCHAVEWGFLAVVTMDADGEHDPDCLPAFAVPLLEGGVPLVLGIRPRRQRLSETVMGWWVKLRFGVDDALCGMKGYHAALYRENSGFDHRGSIGTELAINTIRRGHAFVQVSVSGTSRADRPRFGSLLRANYRIFRALFLTIVTPLSSVHGRTNDA